MESGEWRGGGSDVSTFFLYLILAPRFSLIPSFLFHLIPAPLFHLIPAKAGIQFA